MSNSEMSGITRQHETTSLPELYGVRCSTFKVVCLRKNEDIGPLYLHLGGTWHRFFLDAGLLFWKEGQHPEEDDDLLDGERYVDWGKRLHIVGVAISELSMADSTLTLGFENGAEVVLHHGVGDEVTSVESLNPGD